MTVNIALRVLHTGNLDPNFYHWPSFTFYLNALVYAVYFLSGRVSGRFAAPTDLPLTDFEAIAVGLTTMPEEFLLSRALTIFFGTLSILCVYLICCQMPAGKAAGWVAALFFAVETVSVRNSQFIRPDTVLVFFVLLSLLFSLRIIDEPSLRNYIFAAVGVGLATSSKYNAAFVCIPILIAHLIRFGVRGFFRREIYFAGLVSVGVFFVTMPYALFDWMRFLQMGLFADAGHYFTGHAGGEGDTLRWYVDFLWSSQGALLGLAVGEIISIALSRDRKGIVVLAFPLIYFAFINLFVVRFETTILPVIPFVSLLAALFIVRVWSLGTERRKMHGTRSRMAFTAVVLFLAMPMALATAQYDHQILQPDSRDQARPWIDANLPPGARIALEPYSPYVDRQRFMVQGFDEIQSHPPDWYPQNGCEYLIFSYGSFGRFYENPARYAKFVQLYDSFFSRFVEVARFTRGEEIRIYKTDATLLPNVRIGARFGIFAPYLEFVGYDSIPKIQPGEPLSIALYWRGMERHPEPVTLTTKLLDRSNQTVAQATEPLIFDERSPDRMTQLFWKIQVPQAATPGVYQMEMDLESQNWGRVPILSFEGKQVSDKLFVGPFKIASPNVAPEEIGRARRVDANFENAITLVGY